MSNFKAFSAEYLEKIIDPFLPGAVGHITPIMYQAYTPDIFMFLFRTTGKDDVEHYFVSFQYDYVEDMEKIAEIVEQWTGDKPIRALATAESDDSDDRQFVAKTDDIYKCVMLMVPRPKKLGYWSEYVVVRKGDDIDEVLKEFTPGERKTAQELLAAGSDDRTINVFKHNGKIEFFYSA